MQPIRTFHRTWAHLFALLITLSAWTSVAAKAECLCTPEPLVEAVASCCQAPTQVPTVNKQATACHHALSLTSNCCCDKTPRWNALANFSDVELKAPFGPMVPLLLLEHPTVALPVFFSLAELRYRSFLPYVPPLRHQDLSVLFQSFLC